MPNRRETEHDSRDNKGGSDANWRYFALACKQPSQVGQDENMSKSTFHIPDPLKTLEFQMFLVINRSSIYRKISVHQWQHFLRQRKFVLQLRIQVLNMIYIYTYIYMI